VAATLNDDEHLLASLGDHPGWRVLEDRLTEHCERLALVLAQKILRGEEIDLQKENVQLAGARWLLRQPADAKTRVQKDTVSSG
jgi:hypothetical protein